jgi:hypothetical protein
VQYVLSDICMLAAGVLSSFLVKFLKTESNCNANDENLRNSSAYVFLRL